MKKVDLSKFNNDWYNPGPKIKIFAWLLISVLFFENSFFTSIKVKRFLLRLFGCRLGLGLIIKPNVKIKYPWKLYIGNNCWLGEYCWIDNLAEVTLENNVCISQGAYLLCGNHDFTKTAFDLMIKPIKIRNGAWVGAKSVVCPGVILNEFSILSVSSIATSNLEAYGIYQGNPAEKIKTRVIY